MNRLQQRKLTRQEPDSNPNARLLCTARTGSLLTYQAIWVCLRERDIRERDIRERDIGERDIRERDIRERDIGEGDIRERVVLAPGRNSRVGSGSGSNPEPNRCNGFPHKTRS